MLGKVLRRVDEPAEDDRVVTVGQQTLELGDQLGELPVLLRPGQLLGGGGQGEEAAPLRQQLRLRSPLVLGVVLIHARCVATGGRVK